jgi:hypothetical protein
MHGGRKCFLAPADFREAKLGLLLFQLDPDGRVEQGDDAPHSSMEREPRRNRVSKDAQPLVRSIFESDVDLRGLKYERIDSQWELLLSHQEPYSRQPYAQLEATLRAIGDDETADRVYFAQRSRESKNRLHRHNLTDLPGIIWDLFVRLVSGYGVMPSRLIVFTTLLIFAGAVFYLQPGSVSYADAVAQPSGTANLDWIQAAELSLDQTLPFDIDAGKRWKPSDQLILELWNVRIRYAEIGTFQTILGLVVVPLGIAALAKRLWKDYLSTAV